MRRILLTLATAGLIVAACGGQTVTPTPATTPTPTPAPTATPTPVPTPTATPTPAPVDATWITVAPAGSGFSAKFPGEPKLQETTTPLPAGGSAPTSMWLYEASAHEAYIVAKVVYPASAIAGKGPAVVYDGAIAGIKNTNGGMTLQEQGDVTLGTHVGRSFTMTTAGAAVTMKGALYLVGSVLYMVYAAYDSSGNMNTVNAFAGDFQLTA